MFICGDCGKLFEEPKEWSQNHGEPHLTERWSGCPDCGGGFEEAYHCKQCYNEFMKDDLTEGYCEECLKEIFDNITYETALKYLIEKDLMVEFMYNYYYGVDVVISPVSDELEQDTIDQFKRKQLSDIISKKNTFLKSVISFIKDDTDDYLEYFNNQEVN